MTKAQIVSFLRKSVNIQNPNKRDSAYLIMSDEDISLYIDVVITRDFPEISFLDDIPQEFIYPIVLLAKKELYFTLATIDAPLIDMTADNNNQLKRSQRFEHYMKLVGVLDDEYAKYCEDGATGTRNTLTSYEVLLSDGLYTRRTYEKGVKPTVYLHVGEVTDTTIEVSWSVRLSHFRSYKVYVSSEPILDEYNLSSLVSDKAKLVAEIHDVHKNGCRVEGLDSNSVYHIAVVVTERSFLTGASEVVVSTTDGSDSNAG